MREPREPSEISPKTFFIKIDRSTIKNSEDMSTMVLEVTLVGVRLPEGHRLRLIRTAGMIGASGDSQMSFMYMAGGPIAELRSIVTELQACYINRVAYTIRGSERRSWDIFSPAPSYDYEATEVSCGLCLAKFPNTALKHRSSCPICGVEDCCYLEYEHLDPAQFALEVG